MDDGDGCAGMFLALEGEVEGCGGDTSGSDACYAAGGFGSDVPLGIGGASFFFDVL
jgi:hypothetical protein